MTTRAMTHRSSAAPRWVLSTERHSGRPRLKRAHGGGGQVHSAAGARGGPAVPDADRGYFLDLWTRHGGYRTYRTRQDQGWRGLLDRWFPRHAADGLHGRRRMFKKQLDEGMAGDNAGLLLRGALRRKMWSADRCWRSPVRLRRTPCSRARFTS